MYNFKVKDFINEENILKYVSDYDVFKYYIGDFKIGRAMNSPFRKDTQASFNIGYNHVTHKMYYNDYVLGGGNFIMCVMYLFNLSYQEACNKIVMDLNIQDNFNLFNVNNIPLSNKKFIRSSNQELEVFKKQTKLYAKKREWLEHDIKFWKQFGITKNTLELFNVYPVEYSMIGEKIFKLDKYAYCFTENKDSDKTLTIYQPYSNTQKWTKNHDASVWYCWDNLPDEGDILILTKSRKDIMSIFENTNIPCTGLQNEKIIPKEHIINELKNRFKLIYVLYDNDFDKSINWGREFGKKLCDTYNLLQIEIPDDYKSKDFSDLVKNIGVKESVNLLNNLIESHLPF